MSNRYRRFATIAAVIGWLALGLQLLLTIRLTLANGQGAWAGVWIYLGYFTILTNLMAALALTAVAVTPRGGGFFARPNVHSAIAMSIIVVAAIYHLLLRQLWQPQGWQIVGDDALHTVMPVLFVLHWWLAVPKTNLRWRRVLAWQAWPAAYFAYALARGAMNGWYPYPFVDVRGLGYPRVLGNAIGVLLVFAAVGLLLVAVGRWQVRRTAAASITPSSR